MIHLFDEAYKKKKVEFCEGAQKEFIALPRIVIEKFNKIFFKLERDGQLQEPDGKKLGNTGLFEIRVRVQGQWRGLFVYHFEDTVIILKIFQKKTQKTPIQEINTALKRLSNL